MNNLFQKYRQLVCACLPIVSQPLALVTMNADDRQIQETCCVWDRGGYFCKIPGVRESFDDWLRP